MKPYRRWIGGLLLLLLLGVGGVYGILRPQRALLAERYIRSLQKRLPGGWVLSVGRLSAAGRWGVGMDTLRLSAPDQFTLLVTGIALTPDLTSFIWGPRRLSALVLDSLALSLPPPKEQPPTATGSADTLGSTPWARLQQAHALGHSLLGRLPRTLQVRAACLTVAGGAAVDTIRVHRLGPTSAEPGLLEGTWIVPNDTATLQLRLEPRQHRVRVGWRGGTRARWTLPAVAARTSLTLGGNQAELDLQLRPKHGFVLGGSGRHLSLVHPLLASGPVQFGLLEVQLEGRFLPDGVVLDSATSSYRFNAYHGFVGGELRTLPNDTLLTFSLGSDTLSADAVLDSLPRGLLPHIEGMAAAGRFRQHLYVRLRTHVPDSALFHPTFWCDSCRVLRWGAANPLVLNDTFTHRTYREQRRLRIAPGSPDFTPLAEISPYLWNAVMVSEDGGVFSHPGFYPEMLGKALAANLSRGRIVRGGSTISMQLVKNVFLTPQKHLGRKVEEALLVWLIESRRLVPKRRMLEVYLNVIEWGPGVYGITEAARYYFDRHPAQLYYPEAIFLALIVPSPRNFRFHFDSTGRIKPHVQSYYSTLMDHLERRGIIRPEERGVWDPQTFRLTGMAARALGQQPPLTAPGVQPSDTELWEDLLELEEPDWQKPPAP